MCVDRLTIHLQLLRHSLPEQVHMCVSLQAVMYIGEIERWQLEDPMGALVQEFFLVKHHLHLQVFSTAFCELSTLIY